VGASNSTHIFGTYVPVEEPSTASKADIGPHSITSSSRASSVGSTSRPSAH
jgi:hypothetical protein